MVGLGVPFEYEFAVRNRARLRAGWLVTCGGCYNFLAGNYARAPLWMQEAGIEVSLFIAPEAEQVEAAARVGSQFVELHTGAFAENFHRKRERAIELERLIAAANQAHSLGLRVNAGHGLNYQNLAVLLQVPHLVELNIGHSIISRAVVVGLATAVREMLLLMGATGETNT